MRRRWGGRAGTKSYLACRSIPEVKLDRRWLRPGSRRGDYVLSAPWHFPFSPLLSLQLRRRSSCGAPETMSCIGPCIIRSCDQRPCYFYEDASESKKTGDSILAFNRQSHKTVKLLGTREGWMSTQCLGHSFVEFFFCIAYMSIIWKQKDINKVKRN